MILSKRRREEPTTSLATISPSPTRAEPAVEGSELLDMFHKRMKDNAFNEEVLAEFKRSLDETGHDITLCDLNKLRDSASEKVRREFPDLAARTDALHEEQRKYRAARDAYFKATMQARSAVGASQDTGCWG